VNQGQCLTNALIFTGGIAPEILKKRGKSQLENIRLYFSNRENVSRLLNRWDIFLLLLIFTILFILGWTGTHLATPYAIGEPLHISLDPTHLPFYAARTVLRLFIALFFSILFTFIMGTLAAKNRRAEQLIVPLLDILQSIPVLSFLSITVTGFIQLFPGSLLGPECASIFAIFTAQVWNITFSFYQSLKSVPPDLIEAANMFQLSAWQRFWKIEVPFSMPSLLWNLMVSMSASWFFVVLSETIIVAHQNIQLPGVGSYIALAISQHQLLAVGYAILTMIVVIFLYDQILFRPLITWSEKFKMEQSTDNDEYSSWLVTWLRSSRLVKHVNYYLGHIKENFLHPPAMRRKHQKLPHKTEPKKKYVDYIWNSLIIIFMVISTYCLFHFILSELQLHEITHVLLLGTITGTRVLIAILLSSILWIPVGIWIGMRPSWAQKAQPIIQFFAAFPANLFYPLFVIFIVYFHLNVEIWVTPLMILGAQWYILFNVIAGASLIPRDLCLVADNFGVTGWQWWKRLALPSIFPFYLTGAITAAGGAWNASIVTEWVSWGDTTLKATGLGGYIQSSTIAGDFPKIALGTAMMCLFVLMFNHLFWRPLYRFALDRFNIN
jgi:NitT/TauT family transport system permease protein